MPTKVSVEEIGVEFVPQARTSVADVEIDGEAVLYDEQAEALHVLNSTAALVWACCDGSGSVAAIADDLAQAFGADPGKVLADVVELVRRFGRSGLLVNVAV
jgi:hypothetical protein